MRCRVSTWDLICVYTPDFTDENDVYRVREALKVDCGVTARLKYKPDIHTHVGVYSYNRQEHCARTFLYEK